MYQKTDLYAVFHLNLSFSCIPSDHYPIILERCYWPLLDFADRGLARWGIEMPAVTLQMIQKLDPSFIKKLSYLIQQNKIEFIGSGLVQAILPLIPYDVNQWNVSLGHDVYQEILGVLPITAYIHEQSYASSLVGLFQKAGYQNMIFDWLNAPDEVVQNTKLTFKCPNLLDQKGEKIRLIWNNFTSFQFLQKFLHEEIEFEDYWSYFSNQIKNAENGAFCFYGSDIEMIDYRPGQADVLYGLLENKKERQRFESLLNEISKKSTPIEWKLPSEIAKKHAVSDEIRLETADYPVPTKKQETYNVTRWAVSGRQNSKLNTLCHKAYKILTEIDATLNQTQKKYFWKKLCLAWASDYRTHTTEEKFLESQILTGSLLTEIETLKNPLREDQIQSMLSKSNFKVEKNKSLIQYTVTKNKLILKSNLCELGLNFKKGTILYLKFPMRNENSIIGTIPQGTFNSFQYAVDYHSGHVIVERPGQFRYLDRDNIFLIGFPEKFLSQNEENVFSLTFKHSSPHFILWKTYFIYTDKEEIKIQYHFHFKDLPTARVRFGVLTLLPNGFEKETLWYATHNGGKDYEYFLLKNSPPFDSGDPLGFSVSSLFCLGATNGSVLVGDKNFAVEVYSDKSEQYSVPLIAYIPVQNSYLLRLSHSISEWDDTANLLWRGHVKATLNIKPYFGKFPTI